MDGGSSSEEQLLLDILDRSKREEALAQLGKQRENLPNIGVVMWNSYGIITTLLQEVVKVYPMLNRNSLTNEASNVACNVLALLQSVASHPNTRVKFIDANIPLYLYPFLNVDKKGRPYEYLRLTSLGVIGALVKSYDRNNMNRVRAGGAEETDVIQFLLNTEVIPLLLKSINQGSDLSQTVATFIIQKILQDDMGLAYVCELQDRLYTMINVFEQLLQKEVVQKEDTSEQSGRLPKYVVTCYARLASNQRGQEVLRSSFPNRLLEPNFLKRISEPQSRRQLATVLLAVGLEGEALRLFGDSLTVDERAKIFKQQQQQHQQQYISLQRNNVATPPQQQQQQLLPINQPQQQQQQQQMQQQFAQFSMQQPQIQLQPQPHQLQPQSQLQLQPQTLPAAKQLQPQLQPQQIQPQSLLQPQSLPQPQQLQLQPQPPPQPQQMQPKPQQLQAQSQQQPQPQAMVMHQQHMQQQQQHLQQQQQQQQYQQQQQQLQQRQQQQQQQQQKQQQQQQQQQQQKQFSGQHKQYNATPRQKAGTDRRNVRTNDGEAFVLVEDLLGNNYMSLD